MIPRRGGGGAPTWLIRAKGAVVTIRSGGWSGANGPSLDDLAGPAVPSRPVGAGRTGRPLVVDALLVRAADDAVHHGGGPDPEPVEERQDLLRGVLVLADVGPPVNQ